MGKAKGRTGENEVRDLLRPWWAPVEPDCVIVRTPASGGWHAATAFRAAGDLMVSPGSRFPWSVEVKRREGWSPSRFIAGGKSPVWSWWAQSCRDAAKVGVLPMLWARRSRAEWLVLLPFEHVASSPLAPFPDFVFSAATACERGATVVPVGYLAPAFLASDPLVWLPSANGVGDSSGA